MESAFALFLSSIVFGYSFSDFVILKKAKRWHHIGLKKGYHIHHSMWGIAAFVLTPFALSNIFETLVLIRFGIGIIVEHTVSDSFVFINKVKQELEEDAISLTESPR